MRYQKTINTTGNWVKAKDLFSGSKARIVSETRPMPSQFQDKQGNLKNQDVAKVKFEGVPESLNVALNKATINGLIDAFGEDSAAWQGHDLTVETEKMRVAGKSVTALYLIPDGYEKVDNDEGYAEIVKKGQKPATMVRTAPIDDDVDRLNAEVAGMEKDEVGVPF